jgi:hypothetical protein
MTTTTYYTWSADWNRLPPYGLFETTHRVWVGRDPSTFNYCGSHLWVIEVVEGEVVKDYTAIYDVEQEEALIIEAGAVIRVQHLGDTDDDLDGDNWEPRVVTDARKFQFTQAEADEKAPEWWLSQRH